MSKKPFLSGGLSLASLLLMASPSIADTSVADLMAETKSDDVGQVTSVSQLRDVFPTDWAFQAVQSLVERYGCIAGYPNGTFRGNNKATRYEMAAALNACLDQISDRFASKADIDMVKALQAEFAAELATLRGRVDGLEARVATVEAQQFSTTTKLHGQAIFAGQFGDTATADNSIADSRVSAIARVELEFITSFNGTDSLEIGLETGNGGTDFFSAAGLGNDFSQLPVLDGETPLGDAGLVDFAGEGPGVELDALGYTFKPAKHLAITVGPVIYPSSFIDSNSYANDESVDFSSSFFINNPLIISEAVDDDGGAGAAFDWNVGGGPVSVRGLFIAADGANPAGNSALCGGAPCNGGLFGDPYQASAEIEYAADFNDKSNFAIRLQYTNSSNFNVHQNIVGVNAEATFGKFGVFGRYGISLDPRFVGGDLFPAGTDNTIQTWMAGAGISDLLIPGSILSAGVGQPFIVNNTAVNDATQTNIEAFYRIPVSDNITVTPAFMYIINPLNTGDSDLVQGLMRATFSF